MKRAYPKSEATRRRAAANDETRGLVGMPRLLKREESFGELPTFEPTTTNGVSVDAHIYDSERQQYCGFLYVTRVSQGALKMRIGDLLHASTRFFIVVERNLSAKIRHRHNYTITWSVASFTFRRCHRNHRCFLD